jgi:hypothetical protein
VADLGLAPLRICPAHAIARLGGYMAPEQSDSKRLSQEAAVYSFGVLILEAPSGCERRRCGDAARRARLSRAAARAEALHGQRGGSVAGAGERQDDFAVRRSRLRILNIFLSRIRTVAIFGTRARLFLASLYRGEW